MAKARSSHLVRIKLKPGNLYLFWGYRSIHTNEPCDPDKTRATALFHYVDPHTDSRLKRALRGSGPVVTCRIAVWMELQGGMEAFGQSCSPARCAARSGALLIRGPCLNEQVWVPALRRSVKDAAPRPAHEFLCPLRKTDKNCSVNKDGRFQSSSPLLGTIPAPAHDLAETPEKPTGDPARNNRAEAFTSL